ncbi:AEC family transporter [Anabaena cylindrica FACHB-243]|uniref:AEC family transporter n=1 Tax=Anabaena TaxID=1163 RepID=UPI0005A95DB5|nr:MULTISPECIES: AEC family transporter [Anabaena]MBD2416355.1 AEC family transporter [Anabaena cylindrica FACHB-243]MBY5285651.1 AEC family transporter [Anabaena sp. CCAP 1446/1C]MBY5311740.1 AEC family transporter [Anabaena sp. CCAP 1446/1C]MCM2407265.1 AEC family transporter [Anabaena sp. CCAP 1446/1C]
MINLLELYVKLVGLVLVGVMLGRKLPAIFPNYLCQFLFWVGVPISIIAFLRQTDLSGQIWIAPAIAYLAILLGAFLAWLGIKGQAYLTKSIPQPSTQGSLILAAMVGNTGYLGFPITLAMVGKEYFAWALFYDLLGTLFGAYGLGVLLAARFGNTVQNHRQMAKAIFINPALWSFGFGLLFRQVTIPNVVEIGLDKLAWCAVASSLILIGMRLARLNSWHKLKPAGSSIVIKMLLVPLILGSTLPLFGVTGDAAQVIVLQMAMPPAFATLVIAETFNLDRDLAVTALAMGTMLLLVTLPVWLWLF